MQVVANVDEADIGQVKVGQRVSFSVDAYPDDKFEGTVTQVRLSPTTESNVVTYEVIVAAPNPELKLIPGLTANLTIYVTEETNALLVPYKALRFTPHEYDNCPNLPEYEGEIEPVADGVKRVWVVNGKSLKPVIVEVGASNGTNVSIKSGLSKGDVVALDYSAEAAAADDSADDSSSEQSPFAPTPPGKKK
jgi:HlyD family secretion protein